MSSSYISSLLGLKQISEQPLIFENTSKLQPLANLVPIAYGGHLVAQSAISAYHSLPGSIEEKDKWVSFSVAGNFLGPTALEYPVQYRVNKIRDTRTFSTRSILVTQAVDGVVRNTMSVTIDFCLRIPEDAKPAHETVPQLPFEYSAKPTTSLVRTDEDLVSFLDYGASLVEKGELTKKQLQTTIKAFELASKIGTTGAWKDKIYLHSVFGSHVKPDPNIGFPPKDVTTVRQGDWIKCIHPLTATPPSDGVLPLSRYITQVAFLLLIGDQVLSFYPMTLHGLPLSAADAVSTLEFNMRIIAQDFDFEQFHLREFNTIAARHHRTLSESRIWNEDGQLIGISSQVCIARPKRQAKM